MKKSPRCLHVAAGAFLWCKPPAIDLPVLQDSHGIRFTIVANSHGELVTDPPASAWANLALHRAANRAFGNGCFLGRGCAVEGETREMVEIVPRCGQAVADYSRQAGPQ